MTRVILLSTFLIFGYGIGWTGGFVVGVKKGSRLDKALERVQLICIGTLAVFMILLPIMTGFHGAPPFAFASTAVLVTALGIFRLTWPNPIFALSPASGSRAKLDSEQRRSRWLFSIAWTIGYVLAGIYVATIFPEFG